jgi:hypothetical protein
MMRSRSHEFSQCFNAQAAIDTKGSQLVLGARIARNASDRVDGCDARTLGST